MLLVFFVLFCRFFVEVAVDITTHMEGCDIGHLKTIQIEKYGEEILGYVLKSETFGKFI